MAPWLEGITTPDDLAERWHLLGVVVNQGTDSSPLFVETERDPSIAHH